MNTQITNTVFQNQLVVLMFDPVSRIFYIETVTDPGRNAQSSHMTDTPHPKTFRLHPIPLIKVLKRAISSAKARGVKEMLALL